MKILILISLLLATMLVLFIPASAQPGCDKPFEGAGTLRFPTHFWTRTDFCQRSVPFSEIRSGGVAPDGIPPIDEPRFETIAAAREWLPDLSPVITLEVSGEARAYPLAILIWHEIVNDEISGLPVAVTFCPLCNSSIVFERRVGDNVLRFGVSGNLRNSDLIMWDDATQSWWQQVTGEAIVGVYTGTQLQIVPSLVTGFGAFAAQYPDGRVLSRDTGFGRGYGRNPYVGYDSEPQPFLFEGELDPRLPATAHILAGVVNGVAVAYPFSMLAEARVINDTVGGAPVVALWQPGAVSALDASSIDQSRDVGMASLYSRVVGEQELTFLFEGGQIRDEQTGSLWNVFGVAVTGELTGSQLVRQMAAPHFWFAWAAFRPDTLLYSSP